MSTKPKFWDVAPADRPSIVSHTAATGIGLLPSQRAGYWRARLKWIRRGLAEQGVPEPKIDHEVDRFTAAVNAEVQMRRRLAEPTIAAETAALAKLYQDHPLAAGEVLL